jgi:DNA-binding CsgD family transcriptional regulator
LDRSLFKYSITVILLFILSITSGCGSLKTQPQAVKGVMDLSGWDFEKDGSVRLDGYWRFYWKELLNPEDPAGSTNQTNQHYFHVPGIWNDLIIDGKKLTGAGYCTLTLTVNTAGDPGMMGIKAGEIGTAYRLWVNGRLLASNGTVGTNEKEMSEKIVPQTVLYRPEGKTVTFILQASNFRDRHGGPWSSIYFGKEAGILSANDRNTALELILVGVMLIVGLYQLLLSAFNRHELSFLYFGIFCFLIALRTMVTGEIFLLQIFPNISHEWFCKLVYLSTFLPVSIFIIFMMGLFPDEVNIWFMRVSFFICMSLSLLILFTPLKVYTGTLTFFNYVIIFFVFYVLYALFKAVLHKRYGALFVFIGFMILGLLVFHDVLVNSLVINNIYLLPYGLFFFIISHSIILSMKYSSFNQKVNVQVDMESPVFHHLCSDCGLSKREKEVMVLLMKGMDYRDISGKLFISVATLKKHIHSIYQKTNVKNRLELVRRFVSQPSD